MIDIHSHILPRVDDGSEDMSMSLDMARMYLENGIKTVIATPHHIQGSRFTSLDENKESLEELKKELTKEGLSLEVLLGNEIFVSLDITEDIRNKKACTLNGTRYVLIELPMFDIPLYVENVIYDLLLGGYIPIIAHPERNAKIIDNPNILYDYINKGALAQLNLPSLEGKYGSKIRITAEILLRNNMIHFTGTDAHTNRGRSPRVGNSLDLLRNIVGKENYEMLTYKNAEILLENMIININPPTRYEEKKGFLSLLRNKIGMF